MAYIDIWTFYDQIPRTSRTALVHVIVLVSLLNWMVAFMLNSEYTTSSFKAKSIVRHNFQSSSSKQARQTFHWFVVNSHFIQPSERKYVLIACLSVRLQVLFIPLRSNTLAGDFLSAQLIYRGKVKLFLPLYDFRGKESNWFFADVADREN